MSSVVGSKNFGSNNFNSVANTTVSYFQHIMLVLLSATLYSEPEKAYIYNLVSVFLQKGKENKQTRSHIDKS